MKRKHNVFLILGSVLILCSLALLLGSRLYAVFAKRSAEDLASRMEALLPQRTEGIPGEYHDPGMPMLELDGTDFSALVEFPGYGVSLPVCDSWDPGMITSFPCRFWGSAYDSTLVIGGSDQLGQFDFFHRLEPGDSVNITDMQGSEFRYQVSCVERHDSAEAQLLCSGGYPMTLFVRSAYSAEYLIVRCS